MNYFQNKKKPTRFRKLISMLAIYCARLDALSKCASIYKTPSLKSKLSLQIFRGFKKYTFLSPNQIFAQFFLLRPQWLSMMGISAMLCDMTGISLRNISSIKRLSEALHLKELKLLDETDCQLVNDSELHIACRYVFYTSYSSSYSINSLTCGTP